MSRDGSLYYDPKPIMQGHTEIIGFPSSSISLTVPVAGWYQPRTSTSAGDEDETVLYGFN